MDLTAWLLMISALVIAGLALVVIMQTRRFRRQRKVLSQLSASLPMEDGEELTHGSVPEQAMQIGVVVLNPMQLAEQRSSLAAGIGTVAPGLVRRKVYAIVAKQLSRELEQRGVKARVEVQRVD